MQKYRVRFLPLPFLLQRASGKYHREERLRRVGGEDRDWVKKRAEGGEEQGKRRRGAVQVLGFPAEQGLGRIKRVKPGTCSEDGSSPASGAPLLVVFPDF